MNKYNMKGQLTPILKTLALVAAVVAFVIIIYNLQFFQKKTVEQKASSELQMSALSTLQKLINSKECLAYSYENTTQKSVLDLKKIEEFVKEYKNREPDCAKVYPYDYYVTIEQVPTNFSIYPKYREEGLGVILTIDRSGSMMCCIDPNCGIYSRPCCHNLTAGKEKWNKTKEAAKMFVDELREKDKVGLVSYSSSTRGLIPKPISFTPLTQDHEIIKQEIDKLVSCGGTNIKDALDKGIEAKPTHIVLLSDGCWNEGGDPTPLARRAATERIIIYTIGLGEEIKENCTTTQGIIRPYRGEDVLIEIANITGGEYFYAPTADVLKDLYIRVAEEIPKVKPIAKVNISERIWTFGINKSFEGVNQYSPEESTKGKITVSIPVVIRYGPNDYKRGRAHITMVEGELEILGSLLDKLCGASKNETIEIAIKVYIHNPIHYSSGKLCMKEFCKMIDCQYDIEFEEMKSKGEYYVRAEFDGNKIRVSI